MKYQRFCVICKKEMWLIKSYIEKKNIVCCSKECSFKNRKGRKKTIEHKIKIGLAHKGKKRAPFSISCIEKMRTNGLKRDISILHTPEANKKRIQTLTGKKGKPVSEERKKEYSLRMTGAKNPAWKGGISNKKEVIRNHAKYKLWRKSVFERDSYTCQFCGIRGGYLEVDHIIPLSHLVKDIINTDWDFFMENIWLTKDILSIENGRTLCKPCHQKTDTHGSKYRWSLKA